MLTQCISDTFITILVFPHTSYNREKYRRVAFPKSRVGLPQILFPIGEDTAKFGSMRRYLNSKLFVGDCFHIIQFSVGYFE